MEQTSQMLSSRLRAMVRGAYDLQKIRMQMGSRIFQQFKSKLGINDEDDLNPDADAADSADFAFDAQPTAAAEKDRQNRAKELLKTLKENYQLLTEGIARSVRNRELPSAGLFTGNEVISTYTELVLVHHFLRIHQQEDNMFNSLKTFLAEYPVYDAWLKDVVGVGPVMAGVLLSEFDIYKANYPSSLWRYAGLDVAADGRGRGRYKEHLIEVEYTNKKGELATRNSLTFNPSLKTKLVGVLATSFLRTRSPYSQNYHNYRNRLAAREEVKQAFHEYDPWTRMHVHNASLRYMVKGFLIDLYANWRAAEGLPVSAPYHEVKLGLVHGGGPLFPVLHPQAVAKVAEMAGVPLESLMEAIGKTQRAEAEKAEKKAAEKAARQAAAPPKRQRREELPLQVE